MYGQRGVKVLNCHDGPRPTLRLCMHGMYIVCCTSKHAIMFITGGVVEERETEMMTVRWRQMAFHSKIPAEEQQSVPPCGHCFAVLIIDNLS